VHLVELSVMEQRYQAVMAVVQDGWKVTEVAERLGVTRQAVHKWIARYQAGGLAALADRSHRPYSCTHQIPPNLEALICEIRRQHPRWGPRRILHELGRKGITPLPGWSIYRCLGVTTSSSSGDARRDGTSFAAGSAIGRCSCGR
jgi:IS30 family transposase